MAVTRKEENRALSSDERDLVGKSHHPAVQGLSDAELSEVVKLVRERRDRARTMADRRRREMRGKSEPRGATPAQADDGSKLKLAVLASAMRRLNGEAERRRRMGARLALVASAHKALAMKQAESRGNAAASLNTRHAHGGLRRKENPRAPALVRPMERGRLRKAAAVAQAKRDAR
ncbi:MAG: hypothetical protein KIT25_11660 [Enhydrobacter sp.]|nr:MAG: hypothetical protein KIT25_11660 [Enhydrobacter sp.]